MRPTFDGLVARTLEVWDDPEFLELSREECVQLLPIAGDEIGQWPTSLRALVGDMPTRADAERGFQDAEARSILTSLCVTDGVLVELESSMLARSIRMGVPVIEMQTPAMTETLDRLRGIRDATSLALMQRLDRATNYHNWALVWRLWREYAK